MGRIYNLAVIQGGINISISPTFVQLWIVSRIVDYKWKESNSFFIISLIPADKLIVILATIIKKIFIGHHDDWCENLC
jgi:hypothetical protein